MVGVEPLRRQRNVVNLVPVHVDIALRAGRRVVPPVDHGREHRPAVRDRVVDRALVGRVEVVLHAPADVDLPADQRGVHRAAVPRHVRAQGPLVGRGVVDLHAPLGAVVEAAEHVPPAVEDLAAVVVARERPRRGDASRRAGGGGSAGPACSRALAARRAARRAGAPGLRAPEAHNFLPDLHLHLQRHL